MERKEPPEVEQVAQRVLDRTLKLGLFMPLQAVKYLGDRLQGSPAESNWRDVSEWESNMQGRGLMAELLLPAPLEHSVLTTQQVGPLRGPTRMYRGAGIESHEKQALSPFMMPRHPHHGSTRGNWENLIPLIHAWLDHGTLLLSYVLKTKG